MDWTWLKDYGALVAATVAAVAAVGNGILQFRRDRSLRRNDWLRATRLPRYVEFIEAALAHRQAIFGEHGEWDRDLGPEPSSWPDYHDSGDRFRRAFAALELVGPSDVAVRAREVQFSLWRYEAQLERDPSDFDQKLTTEMLNACTAACRRALEIPEAESIELEYRTWVKAHPGRND